MHRFDVETLPAGRWRNGGGATREIASRPAGADDFGWRASVADIGRGGPFSEFPGVDRTLTLLSGDGVRLRCPGVFDRLLTGVGEPFGFSGDLALDAELPSGPCRVLNLMVRRGRWTARVDRSDHTVEVLPGRAGVVYALRGSWRADPSHTVLTAGQGVWWDADEAPGGAVAPLSPDAVALWADVTPLR
ncbi:HutD family protein [Streptomyces sp. NPDC059070]|uniref:HutD/Ves family protein n=1 Tax=Streptomyces sp. NPDC059070 TaxID=3346713 RepID=UPI0036AE8082